MGKKQILPPLLCGQSPFPESCLRGDFSFFPGRGDLFNSKAFFPEMDQNGIVPGKVGRTDQYKKAFLFFGEGG